MTVPVSRSHDEATIRSFRDEPEFAAEYLNAILEDGDEAELLQAFKRITAALGGGGEVATEADLHAKTLYRTLSRAGNPEMKTLVAVLRTMGLRLSVRPLGTSDRRSVQGD